MKSGDWGISVVICTFNGKARLRPTLNSVLEQEFTPSFFELIVVDNASQDSTKEFCEQFLVASGAAFPWKIVHEAKPGLNHARLKGLYESKFDFILFCDDDNSLSPHYLKIAFDLLQKNSAIGALGGCGIPAFEGTKPDWFDKYNHSFAVGPQSTYDGKVLKIPAALYGAGTFFRKAPLLKFFDNGFNTVMSDRKGKSLASGGDVEWCYLVQLAGYEIWYDQRLTFLHAMPDSRMQWNYYVRLKLGIASGAGRLLPYVCLLKNRNMSLFTYGLHWFSRTLLLTLVYLKHKIRILVSIKPLKLEVKLAMVVINAKMGSYWLNGINTFRHFGHLKRML